MDSIFITFLSLVRDVDAAWDRLTITCHDNDMLDAIHSTPEWLVFSHFLFPLFFHWKRLKTLVQQQKHFSLFVSLCGCLKLARRLLAADFKPLRKALQPIFKTYTSFSFIEIFGYAYRLVLTVISLRPRHGGVRILSEARYFSLFQNFQTGFQGPSSLLLNTHMGYVVRGKTAWPWS